MAGNNRELREQNLNNLILKDEVYSIVNAALEVHNNLGCGFLESIYQEALSIELKQKGIPFIQQQELHVMYKTIPLRKVFVADRIVFRKIIIELKAETHLTPIDEAQVINYLKATGMEVGLLFNFGSKSLEWKRFANTKRN